MTENERMSISGLLDVLNTGISLSTCHMEYAIQSNVLEDLILCLEELEQYRAIGTPTQIYEKIGGLDVELGKYRVIGTIEEFKALKEKSVAKKAKWHPNPCAEDNRIPICPNCNTIMVRTEIFGRTIDEHCVSCGQAIDWSE